MTNPGGSFRNLDVPFEPGFYVYVHWGYGRKNPPLYVGQTARPMARMAAHSERAPWWPDLFLITWQRFDSRAEALTRESEMIYNLQPSWNFQGVDPENRWPRNIADADKVVAKARAADVSREALQLAVGIARARANLAAAAHPQG